MQKHAQKPPSYSVAQIAALNVVCNFKVGFIFGCEGFSFRHPFVLSFRYVAPFPAVPSAVENVQVNHSFGFYLWCRCRESGKIREVNFSTSGLRVQVRHRLTTWFWWGTGSPHLTICTTGHCKLSRFLQRAAKTHASLQCRCARR